MPKSHPIEFLGNIACILSAASSINKNIAAVAGKARVIAEAEEWSLLLDESFFKTVRLRSSKNIQKVNSSVAGGITGLTMTEAMPVNVPDISLHRQFDKKTDGFHDLRIQSLICAPLRIKERAVGVLRFFNKKTAASFTAYDEKLLADTACLIALALERIYLYQKIEEVSVTDDLTGLYNVRYLNQAIDVEIERSRRYGVIFSLIFMDIDNLKKVNDRAGHLAGSKVLIETARLLKGNLRKIDIVIKYGGDEYVIVLPQTSREVGFLIAERLRKLIENNLFLKGEGCPLKITASFGVASFPDNANDKEDLLRIADRAMYRGKLSTKNIVFAAHEL
jgi:diguanylate cyclase (GGDEF)-like protein